MTVTQANKNLSKLIPLFWPSWPGWRGGANFFSSRLTISGGKEKPKPRSAAWSSLRSIVPELSRSKRRKMPCQSCGSAFGHLADWGTKRARIKIQCGARCGARQRPETEWVGETNARMTHFDVSVQTLKPSQTSAGRTWCRAEWSTYSMKLIEPLRSVSKISAGGSAGRPNRVSGGWARTHQLYSQHLHRAPRQSNFRDATHHLDAVLPCFHRRVFC